MRYYRCRAVLLPVALERYYRWAPRYYRCDQIILKKEWNETSIEAGRLRGCEKDVYVLIPPQPYQSGPPLDSTVTPMKQVHQNRNERATPS